MEKPKSESTQKSIPEKKHEPKQKPSNANNRIERVKELNSPEISNEQREMKTMEKRRIEIEEKKNKKKLKSINDDPLEKYTDSADDELHPLKTDN